MWPVFCDHSCPTNVPAISKNFAHVDMTKKKAKKKKKKARED